MEATYTSMQTYIDRGYFRIFGALQPHARPIRTGRANSAGDVRRHSTPDQVFCAQWAPNAAGRQQKGHLNRAGTPKQWLENPDFAEGTRLCLAREHARAATPGTFSYRRPQAAGTPQSTRATQAHRAWVSLDGEVIPSFYATQGSANQAQGLATPPPPRRPRGGAASGRRRGRSRWRRAPR